MIFEKYKKQVALLLEIIPYIAREECFALKGGSAINLFYHDMPRLSVDLDLVYLGNEERTEAVKNIRLAIDKIMQNVKKSEYSIDIREKNDECKLICSNDNATIKIEPNYIFRGNLLAPQIVSVSQTVQEKFGFAKMKVLAKEELYAGKICAALDRQHPRDLFDIKMMYDTESELSSLTIQCFIIYLLSHNRPIHELLDCSIKDNNAIFDKEFVGMTDSDVSHKELIKILNKLKEDLKILLYPYKQLMFDFLRLKSDFKQLPFSNVEYLPAIMWKMKNLETLKSKNNRKFCEQYEKLQKYFNDSIH